MGKRGPKPIWMDGIKVAQNLIDWWEGVRLEPAPRLWDIAYQFDRRSNGWQNESGSFVRNRKLVA